LTQDVVSFVFLWWGEGDGGQKLSSLEKRVKVNSPLFILWRLLGVRWNIIGLILNFSTRYKWVVNLMPWPYNPPQERSLVHVE